jgi:excinuclease ABC subunit C
MELMESPIEEDQGDVLSSLVKQYYAGRSRLPRQILLPNELPDQVPVTRLLSEQVGYRVELLTPQRGAKAELVRLADENAAEEVRRATTAEERRSKLMEAVGRLLNLSDTPHRMEAFDISNTGSSDIVASMTVHIDGRPLKRDYRHFKLRDLEHADDYASMEQVISRRFRRYLDGDEKFSALPDVLLIDGGAGQVRAAQAALDALNLHIPTFGMVKDDRHRTRALVDGAGREIGIQQNQAIFSLIGRIQEETHRFAIEFHRQQQAGHLKGSALDKIPGIGPARKTALLKHFKSVKAIKEATEAQLQEVVPQNVAQAIYQYFQDEG